MTEQDILQKKRFSELADKSYQNTIYTFTGFLGEAELAVLHRMERELSYAGVSVSGGREDAQRCMVRFGSPENFGYEEAFPIRCVFVEPLQQKFADAFSHRDFLGAVMNLGIERSEIGDIVVADNTAYLFASDKMTPYICENLVQVKHTRVKCRVTEEIPEAARVHTEELTVQVSSARVDGISSKVFRISRNAVLELSAAGRIFVNGSPCENNSLVLREGDVVSVRGFGKYRYAQTASLSKKGKLNVIVEKYI